MKKKDHLPLTKLLKIKNLDTNVFLSFYKLLANDIRKFRILLIKFQNRISELQKDITYSKLRYKLYNRLNIYLNMNKQVYIFYKHAYKKLKIKYHDLNDVPDDYLQDIRKNIYLAWEKIKFFNKNDNPYSIFLRKKKSFNIFDKSLVIFLELILMGFDLNKLRFKFKQIMDKLSMKISNYLRERRL